MKRIAVLLLLAAAILPAGSAEPEKMIFAHYMGCYPVASGATRYHHMRAGEELKNGEESRDFAVALGGNISNFYLAPAKAGLDAAASAELEIKRAMRAGIDGFAVDAWAGGDSAKRTLDALFAAAEKLDAPFLLTICLDASCLPRDPKKPGDFTNIFAQTVKELLAKHGKSPKLARRNGKPLIFGYSSRSIYRTPELAKRPPQAQLEAVADAYDQMRKLVGEPLYLHFSLDDFKLTPEGGKFLGSRFDAVGGFLMAGGNYPESEQKAFAAAVRAASAEWSQPLWAQYNNKRGSLHVGNGLDILRANWRQARDNRATLLQFVTWNDYGEDTILAPGLNTGYTLALLNRYFADWWKLGKEPKIAKDSIHLIYRRYGENAITFPFRARRFAPGVLEVVTQLTAPGEIVLPGRNLRYQAQAGLSFRQFPLQTGTVAAELHRDGHTILALTAPEPVTDKPWREDNSMVAFSSDYDAEWAKDFPGTRPEYYSENRDSDGDGLPDWFEMYYFGTLCDAASATAADPAGDPNGDGVTNLEHYRAQTHPLNPAPRYEAGFSWDMNHIRKRGISDNPDRDTQRSPVWHYRYQWGDGPIRRSPDANPGVPYAGKMCHFSPVRDPAGRYTHTYGWISRTPEGKLRFQPRKECRQILVWTSPVAGVVSVNADWSIQPGAAGAELALTGPDGKLLWREKVLASDGAREGKIAIPAIPVRRGESLTFTSSCRENNVTILLGELQIKLERKP